MSRKKREPRPSLMVSVLAELGSGRIYEGFIKDKDCFTDGITFGSGHITINPAHQTVNTVLHELLHRIRPSWHENYIRRTTTWLMRRMTDDEIMRVYEEYEKRKRKRRRPLDANGA